MKCITSCKPLVTQSWSYRKKVVYFESQSEDFLKFNYQDRFPRYSIKHTLFSLIYFTTERLFIKIHRINLRFFVLYQVCVCVFTLFTRTTSSFEY